MRHSLLAVKKSPEGQVPRTFSLKNIETREIQICAAEKRKKYFKKIQNFVPNFAVLGYGTRWQSRARNRRTEHRIRRTRASPVLRLADDDIDLKSSSLEMKKGDKQKKQSTLTCFCRQMTKTRPTDWSIAKHKHRRGVRRLFGCYHWTL